MAYFGDQTFAWNEASLIKPYLMPFSQMEIQSNTEAFRHAVDCALVSVAQVEDQARQSFNLQE